MEELTRALAASCNLPPPVNAGGASVFSLARWVWSVQVVESFENERWRKTAGHDFMKGVEDMLNKGCNDGDDTFLAPLIAFLPFLSFNHDNDDGSGGIGDGAGSGGIAGSSSPSAASSSPWAHMSLAARRFVLHSSATMLLDASIALMSSNRYLPRQMAHLFLIQIAEGLLTYPPLLHSHHNHQQDGCPISACQLSSPSSPASSSSFGHVACHTGGGLGGKDEATRVLCHFIKSLCSATIAKNRWTVRWELARTLVAIACLLKEVKSIAKIGRGVGFSISPFSCDSPTSASPSSRSSTALSFPVASRGECIKYRVRAVLEDCQVSLLEAFVSCLRDQKSKLKAYVIEGIAVVHSAFLPTPQHSHPFVFTAIQKSTTIENVSGVLEEVKRRVGEYANCLPFLSNVDEEIFNCLAQHQRRSRGDDYGVGNDDDLVVMEYLADLPLLLFTDEDATALRLIEGGGADNFTPSRPRGGHNENEQGKDRTDEAACHIGLTPYKLRWQPPSSSLSSSRTSTPQLETPPPQRKEWRTLRRLLDEILPLPTVTQGGLNRAHNSVQRKIDRSDDEQLSNDPQAEPQSVHHRRQTESSHSHQLLIPSDKASSPLSSPQREDHIQRLGDEHSSEHQSPQHPTNPTCPMMDKENTNDNENSNASIVSVPPSSDILGGADRASPPLSARDTPSRHREDQQEHTAGPSHPLIKPWRPPPPVTKVTPPLSRPGRVVSGLGSTRQGVSAQLEGGLHLPLPHAHHHSRSASQLPPPSSQSRPGDPPSVADAGDYLTAAETTPSGAISERKLSSTVDAGMAYIPREDLQPLPVSEQLECHVIEVIGPSGLQATTQWDVQFTALNEIRRLAHFHPHLLTNHPQEHGAAHLTYGAVLRSSAITSSHHHNKSFTTATSTTKLASSPKSSLGKSGTLSSLGGVTYLRLACECVIHLLDNLRSSLAKNAMLCLNDLFFFLSDEMNQEIEKALPVVIKKAQDTNIFIAIEARKALKTICAVAKPHKIIVAATNTIINAKSPGVKANGGLAIALVVVREKGKLLQSQNSRDLQRIVEVLGKLSKEGAPGCRDAAKIIAVGLVEALGGDLRSAEKLWAAHVSPFDVSKIVSVVERHLRTKVTAERLLEKWGKS